VRFFLVSRIYTIVRFYFDLVMWKGIWGFMNFIVGGSWYKKKILKLNLSLLCVVHLLSEGVPSREDTFLSWHLAPVSEVTRGFT
jgi:hypothetical protein